MSSQPNLYEYDTPYRYVEVPQFDALPPQEWPQQWRPTKHFPSPQSVGDDSFSQAANERLAFSQALSQYRLGESNLPIAPYREYIVHTIANNQTSVISSETGSGKSSQLGLYLLEQGASRIFVTQPRILAARELMNRARQNLSPEYADLAGYLTGTALDSDCGPDARLIYVTEQLLFNMASRGRLRPDDIIINDEAHERTAATVVLLGLMKDLLADNPKMRLVISSATIDTSLFSKYLIDPRKGMDAPVLILPGRTFPVTRIETDATVAATVRKYMSRGNNVLAFEPGVGRMITTWAKAQSRNGDQDVHILYGDQSPMEQRSALNSADHHHVVSSRIGETSITPQGKDVVVDSGLSNVGGYEQGKRVLETVFSSKDTMTQRMGRVGRTKPGTYIVAVPEDTPPPPLFEERLDYERPSIQNCSVAPYISELLANGRKLEDLNLLEQPTHENLQHDYTLLQRLGAIALDNDEFTLTDVGRAMIDLPLDTPLARMVVEARRLSELTESGDDQLRLQVAAAAAVQQVKGILDAKEGSLRRYLHRKSYQGSFSTEQGSDVLFELDVFTALFNKQQDILADGAGDAEARFEKILTDNDIRCNRYYKAVRTYEELCRREAIEPSELQKANSAQRKQIIACQIAGAEELFVQRGYSHKDIRGESRILGKRSTIAAPLARLVIGIAFDLRGLRESGRFQRRFISSGSVVTLEQLHEHAPHRLSEKSVGYAVSERGAFVEKKAFYFDGELNIGESYAKPSPTVATRAALIRAMMTGYAPSARDPRELASFSPGTPNASDAIKQWKLAQKLENKSPTNLNTTRRYEKLIGMVIQKSLETTPLDVIEPDKLDELIPRVYVNGLVRPTQRKNVPDIIKESPDGISIHADEETKEYIPVVYKNNVAYVTIPRDHRFHIKREDFGVLLERHDVKLRIGSGRYQQFDAVFDRIDEQRAIEAEKRDRRHRFRSASTGVSLEKGMQIAKEHRPVRDSKMAKKPDSHPITKRSRRSGFGFKRSHEATE